jgi:hypothetical protein
MSYSTIHNYLSCIASFYKINDIILNTKKIGKFMLQQKRAKKIGAILMKRGFTRRIKTISCYRSKV